MPENDLSDSNVADMVTLGDAELCLSREPREADIGDVRIAKCGALGAFAVRLKAPAQGVLLVGAGRQILQVAGEIVEFVAVDVIDLVRRRRSGTEEGKRDKVMDLDLPPLRLAVDYAAEDHLSVAACDRRAKDTPGLRVVAAGLAPQSAEIGNRVRPLWNAPPLFEHGEWYQSVQSQQVRNRYAQGRA